MRSVKRYIATFFLAIFLIGTLAGAAIAHCDHAAVGLDNKSTDASTVAGDHHKSAMMDHNGHGSKSAHHNSADENSDSSNCFECDGTLCQSQSLVPLHQTVGLDDSSWTLHIEIDFNLKQVFLTKIPQPPKQLS